MHQTLNKKFNIIQQLDQAIKRKAGQKQKSKEHTNKQIISSIQKKRGQMKTGKEKSEEKKEKKATPTKQENYIMRPFSFNNENLKVENILEQKKNCQKKFDKITSLINYMITSAEKVIKFVNTTNFEAEFAVKLFKSDKEILQSQLQTFNFQEIINQIKSNMTSDNRSRTGNITNLQNHSLKNQNSTLKKQLMIYQAEIGKLKDEKLNLNNELKNIKLLLNNEDKKQRSKIRDKDKEIGNLLKQIHEIDQVKKNDKNKEIVLKHNLYLKQKQIERLKGIFRNSSTPLDFQKYFQILQKETKFSMMIFTNSENIKKKNQLEIILKALETQRINIEKELIYTNNKNPKSSFGGTMSKQTIEIKKYIRQKLLPFIKVQNSDETELQNLSDLEILQTLILKLHNEQKSEKLQNKAKSQVNKAKREVQLNQKIVKLEKDLATANNEIATLVNQVQILKIQNQKEKAEDISKLMKQNQLLKANIEQIYDDLREICHMNNLLQNLNEDQINFEKVIQLIRDYLSALTEAKIENSKSIKKLEQNLKEAKAIISKHEQKPIMKDTEKNILSLELATEKKIHKEKIKKIEQLTEEKQDLTKKIQSMTLQIKQNKEIGQKQMAQLKDHILMIESDIQEKEKENLQLKLELNKKNIKENTRYDKLEKQYNLLIKKFDNVKNQYEVSINSERKKFDQFNQVYKSMLNEYQQTKKNYHQNEKNLEQKYNELRQELNLKGERQNSKSKQIESLLEQIYKKEEVNQQFNKIIQEYQYNQIIYKQKIMDNEQEVGDYKTQNEKLKRYLFEVEQKMKSNEQMLEKLFKQRKNIESNKQQVFEELQKKYNQLLEQFQQLQNELKVYKQKCLKMEQVNQLLKEDMQQMNKKLLILNKKCEVDQNQNQNLVEQNMSMQMNIKQLEYHIQELQNKINQLQEQNQIKKEIKNTDEIISEFEAKFKENQDKVQIFMRQIQKLTNLFNITKDQLTKKEVIITNLKNEVINIKSDEEISQELSNSYKLQIYSLKQKLQKMVINQQQYISMNQSLKKLNQKLEKELQDLLDKYQKIYNQNNENKQLLQKVNNSSKQQQKKQKQDSLIQKIQEITKHNLILRQENQILKKQINKIQNQYVLLNQAINQIHFTYKQKETILNQNIDELEAKVEQYEFAIDQVHKEKDEIKKLTQDYIEQLQQKYQDLEKQEYQYIQKVEKLQKENQQMKEKSSSELLTFKAKYDREIKINQKNLENLNSQLYQFEKKYQQLQLENNHLQAQLNQMNKSMNIIQRETQTLEEIDFNQLEILKSYLIESQKQKEIQKMKMANYMNLIKSILKKIVDIEEIQNQDFDTLLEKGAQKVFQWRKNRVWESSNKPQIDNNRNNYQVSTFQVQKNVDQQEQIKNLDNIDIKIGEQNLRPEYKLKSQSHIKSNNDQIKVFSREQVIDDEEQQQQEEEKQQNSHYSNKQQSDQLKQQQNNQITDNNQIKKQKEKKVEEHKNEIDQFDEFSNNTSFQNSLMEQNYNKFNNNNQQQQKGVEIAHSEEFQNFQYNDQLSESMVSESEVRVEIDINNIKSKEFIKHQGLAQQQQKHANDFSDFKQNQLSESMISNEVQLVQKKIQQKQDIHQDKQFDEFADMNSNENQLSKSLIQISNSNRHDNLNQNQQIIHEPRFSDKRQKIENEGDIHNFDEFGSVRDQSMSKSVIEQQNNNNFEDFPDALQKALNSSVMSSQMLDQQHQKNFNILMQGEYEIGINSDNKKDDEFLQFLEKSQIELSRVNKKEEVQFTDFFN